MKHQRNAWLSCANSLRCQCLSSNQIKMIAVVCMVIDHFQKTVIGQIYMTFINNFPLEQRTALYTGPLAVLDSVMLFVGAIAFPLFCCMLAEGYQHTHSKPKFLLRLALFALISELPFDYGFFDGPIPYFQNVFFTFVIGVATLMLLDFLQEKIPSKWLSIPVQAVAVAVILFLAEEKVRGDYGGYGVSCIILLYYLRKYRILQMAALVLLTWWITPQRLAPMVVAMAIYALYNGQRGKMNLKYFFYWFYPAHILLFYAGGLFVRWLGR